MSNIVIYLLLDLHFKWGAYNTLLKICKYNFDIYICKNGNNKLIIFVFRVKQI